MKLPLAPADLLQRFDHIALGAAERELPQRPATWMQWDDVPPPSQDLQGTTTRIHERVSVWAAAYAAGRQARQPIEGDER